MNKEYYNSNTFFSCNKCKFIERTNTYLNNYCKCDNYKYMCPNLKCHYSFTKNDRIDLSKVIKCFPCSFEGYSNEWLKSCKCISDTFFCNNCSNQLKLDKISIP